MVDIFLDVPGLENWSVLFIIFCAIIILPDISLGMRRLHDVGRKGWLYLVWACFNYGSIFIAEPDVLIDASKSAESLGAWRMLSNEAMFYFGFYFTFFILMLVMIFFLTRDSQKGPNKYGPNPKGIGNIDVFE